jgi:hypothetical protein
MVYGLREQQEILNLARKRIVEVPGLSARDLAELLQVMQQAAEAKAGILGLFDPATE